MASSTARVLSRLSSFASKVSKKPPSLSADVPLLKSASRSSSVKRFSCISRLPVELSSVETMLPLHSAIAAARLRSSLSIESQRWGLVPQGISMPL